MLERLRDLIRTLGAETSPEPHFDPDDARLATAALLVHAMAIDGTVSPEERVKLKEVLARSVSVAAGDLDLLIDEATVAEAEAVDLYRFTSTLKRQMAAEQRVRLVENLWEMVYADGKSTEFEENLVWRVAELLAVSSEARIASKLAVARRAKIGDTSGA